MRCPPMRKFPLTAFGSAGLMVATSNDGCASARIGDIGTVDCCSVPAAGDWEVAARAQKASRANRKKRALLFHPARTILPIIRSTSRPDRDTLKCSAAVWSRDICIRVCIKTVRGDAVALVLLVVIPEGDLLLAVAVVAAPETGPIKATTNARFSATSPRSGCSVGVMWAVDHAQCYGKKAIPARSLRSLALEHVPGAKAHSRAALGVRAKARTYLRSNSNNNDRSNRNSNHHRNHHHNNNHHHHHRNHHHHNNSSSSNNRNSFPLHVFTRVLRCRWLVGVRCRSWSGSGRRCAGRRGGGSGAECQVCCSHVSRGFYADDEAGAHGLGIGIEFDGEIKGFIDWHRVSDLGWRIEGDQFGVALQLFALAVERGGKNDQFGVTRLEASRVVPGNTLRADTKLERHGIVGVRRYGERDGVVSHVAGFGVDQLGDQAVAHPAILVRTRRPLILEVALTRDEGEARAIDRYLDLAEPGGIVAAVSGPVGEGIDAGEVADGGADFGVDVVAAVEIASARGTSQRLEVG